MSSISQAAGPNIDSILQETRSFVRRRSSSKNAHIHSKEEYDKICARAAADPESFWADIARELHWFEPWTRFWSGIRHGRSGLWAARSISPTTVWTATSRGLAQEQGGHHLGRRARRGSAPALSADAERGVPVREWAEVARHQDGRSRHYLHADDSRAPSRCRRARASARCTRWSSADFQPRRWWTASTTPEAELSSPPMGRIGAARKSAEAAGGRGAGDRCPRSKQVIVYKRTGRRSTWKAGRDHWWHELMRTPSATAPPIGRLPSIRCSSSTPPARPANPRASSTPPAATCSARTLTHEMGIRSARRRHVLVHRRRRLGDRAQLCRLRPARNGRDRRDVRGRAELSGVRTASGRSARTQGEQCSTRRRRRSAR